MDAHMFEDGSHLDCLYLCVAYTATLAGPDDVTKGVQVHVPLRFNARWGTTWIRVSSDSCFNAA